MKNYFLNGHIMYHPRFVLSVLFVLKLSQNIIDKINIRKHILRTIKKGFNNKIKCFYYPGSYLDVSTSTVL